MNILEPLLSRSQKYEFIALGMLWALTSCSFWLWWLNPAHANGSLQFIAVSVVYAWITICALYFLGIFLAAKVPSQSAPVTAGLRVAMVVTKAPSEPFAVVRETLQAALQQTYPHDTWLADESPTPETLAWCAQNGVQISTRQGRAEYHRTTWPRRTRCKEGNLAFFYDHYGYDGYAFVVQLDADHVPATGYLEEMIRPFSDPTIGYVSAPSICDKNAGDSWSARGRLYHEAGMHGPQQAGYTNGLAPLCIGSHYAVRTAALREIGGLGPELAEDHSTTLFMNAHGWRGVHAIEASAHGEGPCTFMDMITQEFQWSRSLVMLLFQYTPGLILRLPWRLRLQFLFCQCWYPILAATTLCTFVIAPLAVFFDFTVANVDYFDFILYAALPEIVLTIIMVRLARRHWLRPAKTKVVSWEGAFYLLARWPWILLGTLAALRDVWTGSVADFRVTPKGGSGPTAVPFRVLAPYLVLLLFTGLPVLLVPDASKSAGFYVICLLTFVFYSALVVTILIGHRIENPPHETQPMPLSFGRFAQAALVTILVGTSVVLGAMRLPQGLKVILPELDLRRTTVLLGVEAQMQDPRGIPANVMATK